MSLTPDAHETSPFAETFARPNALMNVPLGMASPLWGLFAGAAVGGAAWWWMTRWARPENLEALFGAAPEVPGLAKPVVAAEVVEPAVEAEAAVVEPPVLDAPVGGEAAPVAPALAAETTAPEGPASEAAESASAPKPRAKRTEPKSE